MPKRIQLSHQKGWRMPPGAKKVDRTSQWGNPFKVGDQITGRDGVVAVCISTAETLEPFVA